AGIDGGSHTAGPIVLRSPGDRERAVLARDRDRRRGCDATRAPTTSAHPGAPRCKTCLVPLGGAAAPVVRLVLKRRPSAKNPNYCDVCETFVWTHPGGAEVEISLLYAALRASTAIAEPT